VTIKLTLPQRRALNYLAMVKESSPVRIGEAMHNETYRRQRNPSSQGLGRIGGTMAHRLIRKGLVRDVSTGPHWCPRYAITAAGRAVLTSGD
jgi:hypothetical protein